MTQTQTRRYHSIDEIKAANRAACQHWFSPDTIRFFRTRISDTIYGGRFFVTSETPDDDTPRRYSVRVVHDDGHVVTVGEFREYANREVAHAAAQRCGAEFLSTGVCPCGYHDHEVMTSAEDDTTTEQEDTMTETTDYGTLTDYVTGEPIRPATADEHARSLAAGETGAFGDEDGRAVFVAGGPES